MKRRADLIKALLVTVLFAALILLFWKLGRLMMLCFLGILLAICFRAPASSLRRYTNCSPKAAVGVVILLCVILLLATVKFVGGPIVDQFVELSDQLPRSVNDLLGQVRQHPWSKKVLEMSGNISSDVSFSGADFTNGASQFIGSIFWAVGAFVVWLFLGLYLALDSERYLNGALSLVKPSYRERSRAVFRETVETLRWWLVGKLLSMTVIGVLTGAGLAMMGVPTALALGILAAILTFIPNFGPVLSAIPAVVIAFVISPITALYVVFLYLGIQTIESYLVTPMIQQSTVALPPALTIVAQISLGTLFGTLGVIAASPLTAASLVLVKRLYLEDFLRTGDCE